MLLRFLCIIISLLVVSCEHKHTAKERSAEGIIQALGQNFYYQWPLCEFGTERALSLEDATSTALNNNPNLRAYYTELTIAYGGLVEAGLRKNPVLTYNKRYPNEPDNDINKNFEMMENFLDYFLIPFKENVALAEYYVIESKITHEAIKLIREVEISWLQIYALKIELDNELERLKLKKLGFELYEKQKEPGNINPLKAIEKKIAYEQANVHFIDLEVALFSKAEKLNRLLGLDFNETSCWKITGDPNFDDDFQNFSILQLKEAAIKNRPDLETKRREIYALAQESKLKEWWAYGNIRVGVSQEKETDGVTVTGPAVELELPVYNNGQAERIKHAAKIEKAQMELLVKAIEVCSEVRENFNTALKFQEKLNIYNEKILPIFKEKIALSQKDYNSMALGIFDLLELKEEEIKAKIERTNTLKDYLSSKVELIYSLGGSISLENK